MRTNSYFDYKLTKIEKKSDNSLNLYSGLKKVFQTAIEYYLSHFKTVKVIVVLFLFNKKVAITE